MFVNRETIINAIHIIAPLVTCERLPNNQLTLVFKGYRHEDFLYDSEIRYLENGGLPMDKLSFILVDVLNFAAESGYKI